MVWQVRLALLCVVAALPVAALAKLGFAHLMFRSPVVCSGLVASANGTPLAGVNIDHIAVDGEVGILEQSMRSDVSGSFRFQTLAPTVVLRKKGFRSVLLRVVPKAGPIRVVMEQALTRQLPSCTGPEPGIGSLRFPTLAGVRRMRPPFLLDTFEDHYWISGWFGRRAEMVHGTGTSWGGPLPRGGDVWASVSLDERWMEGNGFRVIDARGKTRTGRHWRSLSVDGESAAYAELGAGAAIKFDRVLDSVCADP